MVILIENATAITMNPFGEVLRDCQLLIKDGTIAAIDPQGKLKGAAEYDKLIDAKGHMVMPGFVNLHTVTATSALRGREERVLFGGRTRDVFEDFYRSATAEESYWFSRLAILEMLRSGVTSYLDCSEQGESSARAAKDGGLRAWITPGRLYDRNMAGAGVCAGLEAATAFCERWQGAEKGRISCALHPYSADTCSPQLLGQIAEAATRLKVPVTMHTASSRAESNCGSVGQYLADAGILSRSFVGIGGYFLTEADIPLITLAHASVAVTPYFGAKCGYTSPVNAMVKSCNNVGIGTAGLSWDMVETMRYTMLNWRVREHMPDQPQPSSIMDFATVNGAKALRSHREIGSLEVGKKADLIILNNMQLDIRPVYKNKFTSNLVHTGMAGDVHTVMVEGRLLLENGVVTAFDEEEVKQKAGAAARDVLSRL